MLPQPCTIQLSTLIVAYIVSDLVVDGLDKQCLVRPHGQSNQSWRLVWQDNFDDNSSLNHWILEHEELYCSGNGIQQVSCNTNRTDNVKIIGGSLALVARIEPYFEYRFTAATITTKKYFSYGRFEIRASLPLGDQIRTSIFTRNQNETYWHQNGQIDIMSNTQQSILYRGVHYADSTNYYQMADMIIPTSKLSTDLHRFHLYGVEWDQSQLTFFMDNHYSSPLVFKKDKYIKPFHQLRLQIGVGGQFFNKPVPDNLNELNWKCPTFLVDYVRVFEANSVLNESHWSPTCTDNSTDRTLQDDSLIEQACSWALSDQKFSIYFSSVHLIVIITVLFVLIFAAVSIVLTIQIAKINRKVNTERTNSNLETFDSIYDPTYAIPVYDNYEQLLKSDLSSYVDITAGNQYLTIQNDNPDTEHYLTLAPKDNETNSENDVSENSKRSKPV